MSFYIFDHILKKLNLYSFLQLFMNYRSERILLSFPDLKKYIISHIEKIYGLLCSVNDFQAITNYFNILQSTSKNGIKKDLLSILSQKNTKEETEFLKNLITFMECRNTPIERPPMLGYKQSKLNSISSNTVKGNGNLVMQFSSTIF